jgi:hypothetical protein
VLVAAARHHPASAAIIRDAYAQVMQVAESAMNLSLIGQPTRAVQTLLQQGGSTGNSKLIELAGLVAKRHQERIDGVRELMAAQSDLARRYCAIATHIAGVRRSKRSSGGMVLRR